MRIENKEKCYLIQDSLEHIYLKGVFRRKNILFFFNLVVIEGIFYDELQKHGHTVTIERYKEQLIRLNDTSKLRKPSFLIKEFDR